jgi:serine/threonine protein phosphatase PrpC
VDLTGVTELRCSGCGAALQEGDLFCEQCGARAFADDPGGDRVELDLVAAAAVSDRGRVHRRNEDAFALEVLGDRAVAAVVCDGISSSSAGDVAARSAADAAARVLVAAVGDGAQPDGRAAVLEAVDAARDAVAQVPWTTRVDRAMPSCTLVGALWRGNEIVVGSVGDSRAYWIDGSEAHQLTVDDSWTGEQVAEGLLSLEQAMRDPRSHSITRWIGPDAPARPARVMTLHPDRPGRLLLCSDGLWNYVPTPAALGELIAGLPAEASAAALARALTDTALVRGGRDNITVAVVDVDPS